MKRFQWHRHVVSMLAATFITACQTSTITPTTPPAKSPGQLLFEEKCRTVAGEKIYRKVEDVEGIVLLKIRPHPGEREWADPMWPGAAFAREAWADDYINTFLGYEYSSSQTGDPVKPNYRGYITTDLRPGGIPGYRYVDVIDEKDGKRYRYTGSVKAIGKKDVAAHNVQIELKKNPDYDLNIYRWTLDKMLTTSPSPRYGVTYEDHVVPEDRELGIASSTVKVIDLQTQEVLGEMTRYAWGATKPSRANPSPWLTAWKCPGHAVGADAATRKFVDQVLIPRKEK